jgi:hypothetical protein
MSAADLHTGAGVSSASAPKTWVLWAGRVLSALPVLLLVFSGAMKISHAPPVLEGWVKMFGWSETMLTTIGVLEIACAVLFAIPRTAVLGAILVGGYLAGAFATHLRIGDIGGGVMPLLLAVFAWGGLYLREPRLRALLPVRS